MDKTLSSEATWETCLGHADYIYNFVYRLTADAALAEDLTQETLIAALSKLKDFRGQCELGTWLLAIAKHLSFKALGRKKRDLKRLNQLRQRENDRGHADQYSQAETEEYIEQIKNGCVLSLLHCLPFYQRCAFILHCLNDIPVDEIGRLLGKTPNAVRILLHRARNQVREFLCGHCEHISENPDCRCRNLIEFSMNQKLLRTVAATPAVESAKGELRRLRDDIDLLKTLPQLRLDPKTLNEGKYRHIFSK